MFSLDAQTKEKFPWHRHLADGAGGMFKLRVESGAASRAGRSCHAIFVDARSCRGLLCQRRGALSVGIGRSRRNA
jgi:hypothetical protein